MAHVLLPASASWAESDGTVTNSERRVQRCRKAVNAPEGAKDELWIINEIGRRLGKDLNVLDPETVWNEFRTVAPHFAGGMSYKRLEEHHGLQWPCPDEAHPGAIFLHDRLWKQGEERGRAAPFTIVRHEGPVETPTPEYPFTLTTGRHLDAYNTGVQTAGYGSPLFRGETLDLSPEDAAALRVENDTPVRVTSRRGSLVVPARIDRSLRPGVVFMTLHYPDEAMTNVLTIDASDPKSGTAEFKACAVRVEVATATMAAAR
jgi:formate dehydrogenase major subunit